MQAIDFEGMAPMIRTDAKLLALFAGSEHRRIGDTCRAGHRRTSKNMYIRVDGKINCRRCAALNKAKHRTAAREICQFKAMEANNETAHLVD